MQNGLRIDCYRERVSYFHANGRARLIGAYRDEKEAGGYTAHYENGRKMEQGSYRDGARHGPWVYFDNQGNATRRDLWRDGKVIE